MQFLLEFSHVVVHYVASPWTFEFKILQVAVLIESIREYYTYRHTNYVPTDRAYPRIDTKDCFNADRKLGGIKFSIVGALCAQASSLLSLAGRTNEA